jgi:drug/metabolite transporter (DMT)-like permease
VMFATLFAWIFLGQLPTPLQFAGGALIFAGVILVRAGEPSAVEVPQPEPVPAEHGSVVV